MARMRRALTPEDVDMIAELNAAKDVYFERDRDRPNSRFVKPRGRAPLEVKRAQQRLRTARWRSEMDRRRAPTTTEVGLALATSLATLEWSTRFTGADSELLNRAFHDLAARGFSIEETKKTLRRLRVKLVNPGDRAGEADESCGPPIWDDGRRLPF